MSPQGPGWRRASRGLLLMGLGVFLLLNTTGHLPWAFWLRLLPFWPVCLIALGLRLVFQRSVFPAGVLLSPLLVLGTMTWVAAADSPMVRWDQDGQPVMAERPDGLERWALEGTVAYGRLDVAGEALAPERLAQGEGVLSSGRPELRTSSGSGSMARVRLRHEQRRRIRLIGQSWSGWRLQVARDLPLSLDLTMALTEARLQLDGVPVTGMDVDGAFNEVDIHLGEPQRDVTIRLEGAFSGFRFHVPEGVPVRVRTDGFLNIVGGAQAGEGPGYRIRLDGAFNHLAVESVPVPVQAVWLTGAARVAAADSSS